MFSRDPRHNRAHHAAVKNVERRRWLHLFAQDKSNTSEATNWSYWKVQPGNDANTDVFKAFVYDATKAGIPLWLFDSE